MSAYADMGTFDFFADVGICRHGQISTYLPTFILRKPVFPILPMSGNADILRKNTNIFFLTCRCREIPTYLISFLVNTWEFQRENKNIYSIFGSSLFNFFINFYSWGMRTSFKGQKCLVGICRHWQYRKKNLVGICRHLAKKLTVTFKAPANRSRCEKKDRQLKG